MKSRAAKSVFTWGLMMLGYGSAFLLAPNFFLTLVGMSPTSEVWIRVAGLLMIILGGYYVICARAEEQTFLRATVPGRIVFALGLATFVGLGLVQPPLLLVSLVDTCGALWTWSALRTPRA